MMKKKYFLLIALVALFIQIKALAQVNVTIKVDMSAETVSPNGVHVIGSINGWNTTSNMLTQEGITNIYSTVIQLNEGWHEYKFLNGNTWGTEESAGAPCAPSNGNRFLYINNSGIDVILETVPFNGCNASGTGFEVTFNVDMTSEGSVSSDGVHLAGSINGWNTGNLQISNISGAIYSETLRFPSPANYPITFEYKYLNGNAWGTDETPDETCSTVTGTNRLVTVNNSGEELNDIFNGCNYVLSTADFTANSLNVSYNQMDRSIKFFSTGFNDEISQIQVVDITGKCIKNLKDITSINDVEINLKSHNNGLYFIRIELGGKQLVKKVIVY